MVLSYEVTSDMLLKDPMLLLHEKDFDGRAYLLSLSVILRLVNSHNF